MSARRLDVTGLVGAPYVGERYCWDLARLAEARLGVTLPEDPAEALAGDALGVVLAPTAVLRAGDLLELEGQGAGHVGVCVDAFTFLHATRECGGRVDRVAVWERAGKVRARVRPWALAGGVHT